MVHPRHVGWLGLFGQSGVPPKPVFQVHGINADGNVIVRCQLKSRHVLPFFQKRPPCLVDIVASALSHRRGGAGVRQGHGYVDQQHHEPNQQYKGEQAPAESREGFYDEMSELWWKFHRRVPRSYGDGRDHS
jgi:hypothetical protein